MKLKRVLSAVLAFTTLAISTASTVGTAYAVEVETKDTPQASKATQSENVSADSSLLTKDQIKNGAILHAWCWDFDTITRLMPEIAAAGYTAVQTSPVSGCYDKYPQMFLMGKNTDGTYDTTGRHGAWFWNYQPTEFSITNYQFGGSEAVAKYKTMCDAARNNGVQIITDIVSNHTTAEKENQQFALIFLKTTF